jgi:hypothetical protein
MGIRGEAGEEKIDNWYSVTSKLSAAHTRQHLSMRLNGPPAHRFSIHAADPLVFAPVMCGRTYARRTRDVRRTAEHAGQAQ